jgi:hypothetical protein
MRKFLLLILLTLISCDPGGYLLINGKQEKFELKTDCGTIQIEENWFIYSHWLILNYKLNDSITLNKDSLNIFFNNHKLNLLFGKSYKLQIDSNFSSKKNITLSDSGKIIINFDIVDFLKKNDTLKIYCKGFINCKNQNVPLDSFFMIGDYKGIF